MGYLERHEIKAPRESVVKPIVFSARKGEIQAA